MWVKPQIVKDWRLNPYPNAHDFGFTIIHDADDSFSKRLKPLLEVFDQYDFKITITVFAFWAEWANNGKIWEEWLDSDNSISFPKAVPLEDHEEKKFYLELEKKGHEIGLHTASDTSSKRKRVKDAFEFFKSIFGYYPKIYVEHSNKNQIV
jgi:hypothetical protein